MVTPLFDITPLLPTIASDTLILTPNSRLRNKILEAYGRYRAERGDSVIVKPQVEAIADWLAEAWQCLLDSGSERCRGVVLSPGQCQLLWRQVIDADNDAFELLNAQRTAGMAELAYRNMALWQLPLAQLEHYAEADTQRFLAWARAFERLLARRQLICREHSYGVLAAAYDSAELPRQAAICLQGFDDLPPLLAQVVTAACDRVVRHKSPPHPAARIYRTELETFEREIQTAAGWALQTLRQQPEATIGIIVPNLGQCRQQVETLFTKVFEAHTLWPQVARYTLPFNFSAGIPLAATPAVDSALQLLGLNRRRLDLQALCALLLSPFFGADDTELAARSELIGRLRELAKPTVSGADLRDFSQRDCAGTKLAGGLQQFEQLRRRAHSRAAPSTWTRLFLQQLQALGWPGSRRLDSNEYQQVSQWYQLLDVFAGLDISAVSLTLSEALKELQQLAQTTHFQAQVPASPIQILGALEGAGLCFTHTWVLGLQQNTWPPAPAPHPLLPVELQRQHHMPHADSERELQFSQSLTEGYRGSAGQVIFSSARWHDDSEQAPSRLIADIALTPAQQLAPLQASDLEQYCSALGSARQLQWVDTSRGPPLAADGSAAPGGSGILQQQAACPFNAFAIYRLGAQLPAAPVPGFSALEKGLILHEALAAIWQQLGSQQALLALPETALKARIEAVLEDIVGNWQQRRADVLGRHYCQLEKERQRRLILQWLAFERQRPPFAVIAAEQKLDVNLAGLPLVLRLDLLDQLPQGEMLLIDYKTGKPGIQRWRGERPREPQLPLYAISLDSAVKGIAFAEINAGRQQLLGIGEFSDAQPGIRAAAALSADAPPTWAALVEHWRAALQALAAEFLRGDSAVVYSDPAVQRYYGDYIGLNRIAEQPALAAIRAAEQPPPAGGAAPP